MKILLITIAGFVVLGNFLPCVVLAKEKQERILTGEITLFQAQQTVLLRNPDLQAFSYEVKAREAETLQASLLPNPKLNVRVENAAGSGNFNGFDQSETTVQLSQKLEMGDKRNLRRYSANLSKENAEWDYEVQRLEVLTRVSKSFTHVLKIQQRIMLTGEGVQLAKKFLNTVSKRVKAGKVAVIEKIKAQVSLANMHMKKERARQDLKNARRKLSVLWGDPKPSFDSAKGDLFRVPEKILPRVATLPSNPHISKWSTALDHRQAELDVENSKAVPDLTLRGGYRRLEEKDDNALIFGVSVPLHWFDRNQGGIAKARYRLSKIQEENRAKLLRMQEALLKVYSEESYSHAKVMSIKTKILPGAKKVLDAISEGYRFGKFGLLDVLDSQKTFFQVQSQYLDALANYHNSVADVKHLTEMGQSAQNIEARKGDSRP